MGTKNKAIASETVQDMKYPSHFYTAQQIPEPGKLHQGADGLLYGLLGNLARRLESTKALESDAMEIHDRSMALRQITDAQLKNKIKELKVIFQTRKAPPTQSVKEALATLVETGDRSLGIRAFPYKLWGPWSCIKAGLPKWPQAKEKP